MVKKIGDLYFNPALNEKNQLKRYEGLPLIFYVKDLNRIFLFGTHRATAFFNSETTLEIAYAFHDAENRALKSNTVVREDFKTRGGIIMQHRIWPLYKPTNRSKPVGLAGVMLDFNDKTLKLNFDSSAPWN